MTTNDKEKLLETMRACAQPMAEIALVAGISYKEMDEVFRLAMVDVATREFGIRDRPTNISRVSVMTGLTRKEVARLRRLLGEGGHTISTKITPKERILAAWRTESGFQDNEGAPITLPYEGEGKSFSMLVRRFGGDLPPGAVRTELKRMGAIEQLKNGDLRCVDPREIPRGDYETISDQMLQVVKPALEGIAVRAGSREEGMPTVFSVENTAVVNKKDLTRLQDAWQTRLDEVAESFSKMIDAYEVLHGSELGPADSCRINMGAYFYAEGEKKKK